MNLYLRDGGANRTRRKPLTTSPKKWYNILEKNIGDKFAWSERVASNPLNYWLFLVPVLSETLSCLQERVSES